MHIQTLIHFILIRVTAVQFEHVNVPICECFSIFNKEVLTSWISTTRLGATVLINS